MEGEAGFRARETKVLLEVVANEQSSVIATGGGIILSAANRATLKENGQVIYLAATKEQLYERTRKDKSRPLLQVDDRKGVIDKLVETRDPLYQEVADLVFPSGSVAPSKLTKNLAEALAGL